MNYWIVFITGSTKTQFNIRKALEFGIFSIGISLKHWNLEFKHWNFPPGLEFNYYTFPTTYSQYSNCE